MSSVFRIAVDFIDAGILERDLVGELSLPPITTRRRWLEWQVLLLAVTFYCLPFVDLKTSNRLPGNESEVFQSFDQMLMITYSKIEAGRPADMFDGDFYSLVRGIEANPFVVDLDFPEPFTTSGLSADFGHMRLTLKVDPHLQGAAAPLHFEATSLTDVGEPRFLQG